MKKEILVNETTLRIRKVMRNNPDMTNEQIARKIGRDTPEGRERVAKERKHRESERIDDIRAECHCGGLFDICAVCLRRQGELL